MSHSTPKAPRLSGIPGPGLGRPSGSGLPTPSRRKSSLAPSDINVRPPSSAQEDDAMSRALTDAIKHNPPSAFRSPQEPPAGGFGLAQSQQRRPSSSTSSNHSFYSAASSGGIPAMPRTPANLRASAAGANNYPSTPTARGSGATSSSAMGFTPRRSMGVPTPRPESRQGERSTRPTSVRGVPGQFAVGEKVRVEGMGMEGWLRFVGEIAGKPGVWAGVELSGGFAGKGKNDGCAGETRYFTCPPDCGIFLQYSKLSSPTTGPGSARPASVMSNRSSVSGRVTPSVSGRATPSGRSTPSLGLPRPPPLSSSLQQSRTASKSSAEASALAEANITAGSRASKYLGMTAKQLSSRTGSLSESTGSSLSKSISTPRAPRLSSVSGIGQPTPTRASYNPRLSLGPSSTPGRSGRSSGAGVRSTPTSEMPPPPSPSKMLRPGPARPASRQSEAFSRPHSRASEIRPPTPKSKELSDLETAGTSLQDKIANLMGSTSGRSSVASSRRSDFGGDDDGDRTFTAVGTHTDAEFDRQRLQIEQLRVRVEGLEKENLTLLVEGNKSIDPARVESASEARAVAAERQVQATSTRLTILESELTASSQTARTLQSSIEALERAAKEEKDEKNRAEADAKRVAKELQAKLEESETLIAGLREAAESKEKGDNQHEAEAGAKKKEIEVLQSRVSRLGNELEQERTELGGQVDALRQAGQDTIMLYEERLHAAESLRFDMETAIRSLEDQLAQSSDRLQAAPLSPTAVTRQATTAAEIDNENLTEQVKHLTDKISSLEDQMEEMQVQAERDEAAAKAKLDRSKGKEADLKKDIAGVRAQMDEVVKAESGARLRISEVEEALRENGVALENARAEIEGLRAEVTNLENLQAGVQTDEHDQLKEAAKRADSDKARLEKEIATLKSKLEDASGSTREAVETATQAKKEIEERLREVEELRTDLKSALDDNDDLLQAQEDLQAELSKQSKPASPDKSASDALSDLRQQHARELDSKNDEIRSLKRKLGSASPNGTEEFLVSENNSPAIPQLRAPMLKKASRESMRSNGSSRLSIGGAKDEDAIMRDQIRGFQHIIEDLRKENSTTQGEMRDLMDERERLLAETEDLRDAVKALELTVEESILLEEGKLEAETAGLKPPAQANGGPPSSPSRDAAKLQKQLAETQVALESQARRHEADFERLQKKLIEVDQKNQREVHELESLIESKIYREDELEREIENLKYEAAKTTHSKIKTNGNRGDLRLDDLTPKMGSFHAQKISDEPEGCELCADPGHQIENCPLFSGDGDHTYDPESFDNQDVNSPLSHKHHAHPAPKTNGVWCEDCESSDHSTADCVYAQEVF